MTKVLSPHAIDYSSGVTLAEDSTVIPNKLGAYVDDYQTALEWAKRWKA